MLITQVTIMSRLVFILMLLLFQMFLNSDITPVALPILYTRCYNFYDQIGGENILTVEFDRSTNSETIYNRNQERILTLTYDKSGRPVHIVPTGPVESLNVTYDQQGRLAGWSRGDLTIANVFEERNLNMVEKKLGNRIFYRYIYKNGNKVLTDLTRRARGRAKSPAKRLLL